MPKLSIRNVDKENWETALKLKVRAEQEHMVPSVAESLATAYIRPWDPQVEPYAIYADDTMVGFFYLSYTPESRDNYWLGGFLIDQRHQGRGLGRAALREAICHISRRHGCCEEIRLGVHPENTIAIKLYEGVGFHALGAMNRYGEQIMRMRLDRNEKQYCA